MVLYEAVRSKVKSARDKIQNLCTECHDKKDLCPKCESEFVDVRDVLKSNLPFAKVALIKKRNLVEVAVKEYEFKQDRLLGVSNLYEHIIDPYIANIGYALEDGLSMLWAGPYETGKTVGAIRLGLGFLKLGYSVYYITFPDLHRLHTASYHDESKADLLQAIQDVDFLIIDELGKETNRSESVRYLADTYLKAREEYPRPTLIITNTDIQILKDPNPVKSYGGSFWSMLHERYRIFLFNPEGIKLRLANRIDWPF